MVAPSGSGIVGVAAGDPLCTFFMKGLLRWPLHVFDFGEVLLSEIQMLVKLAISVLFQRSSIFFFLMVSINLNLFIIFFLSKSTSSTVHWSYVLHKYLILLGITTVTHLHCQAYESWWTGTGQWGSESSGMSASSLPCYQFVVRCCCLWGLCCLLHLPLWSIRKFSVGWHTSN